MLLSLDSAVSALDSFQEQMNVVGNNIANVNTVGYKQSSTAFEDAFSQTLGTTGSGPEQVGTGVLLSGITSNFSQGSITSTGVGTDMAINENGFFIVKDPSTGSEYATRDGEFTVDPNGYLINSSGMRVQGYTDSGLTTLGDIKIDNTGATITTGGVTAPDTSAVQSYTFGSDGTLTVTLADGTTFTRGQILLQNFTDPNQLSKVGDNLYTNLSSAGPLSTPAAPTTNGLGSIVTGSLEMSNVDLAGQLTQLITTQRAYEANTKVVTTGDEILQDLVGLVR
jgi:flagellar hook protein FlgE